MVSGRDDAAARSEPAHRGREGCADPGAVGTGGGAGGAAGRAAEDAGQFQPAAVQGPQGEPAGEGQAAGAAPRQPRPRGRRPIPRRGARPARHRQGGGVRPLPGGAGRGRPAAARPLRQGRPAAGAPGGHQGGALPRPLPVLRRHDPGAGARGPGRGLAVRPVDPGAGALPALHPRHQLPAADPAVPAPVRAQDQRGRLGRDVPAGQAALRRRGRRHPRPPTPRARRLFRRDHGARRRPDPLGLGVPERAGGDPRHPAEPRPGGGGGGAGRASPAGLGLRPVRRPARPRRRLAGLPGAPVARPALRHRGGRRPSSPRA